MMLHPMRQLIRLMEQDAIHGAAGCIFLAHNTKRLLIAQRSAQVDEPGTWGTWGGTMKDGEQPEDTARREAREESGYDGSFGLLPLSVYQDHDFSYSNYLALVDREFRPHPNQEVQDYAWCDFGDWPQPLHYGLVAVLHDRRSVQKIKAQLQ